MKVCPSCEKTYDNDYDYCSDCGEKLIEEENEENSQKHTQICSFCKKTYPDSYVYCPDCDFPLENISDYEKSNDYNNNENTKEYTNSDENTIAKIFRIIAKIVFAVGIIGGILIIAVKSTDAYSYLSALKLIVFNEELSVRTLLEEATSGGKFIEALSIWVHSFITGMFFMAISEVITLLQKIADKKN